jgi:hypothetical protein
MKVVHLIVLLALATPAWAQATLEATPSQSAPAGSTVVVKWSGPNGPGDFVTVVRNGARPNDYLDYRQTSDGRKPVNPVSIVLPAEPGAYEIRYVRGNPRSVLTSVPYEVTAITATLEGPAIVAPGARFEVSWLGPNGGRDWVTIVASGAAVRTYGSYVDARNGRADDKSGRRVATLLAPKQPGRYEVRYVQQGTRVIGTRTIEVGVVAAAPPALTTGSPTASLQGWSGSIRCSLTSGADHQTQTWTLTGAPRVEGDVAHYAATWSVTGAGSETRGLPMGDTLHQSWQTNITAVPAAITVTTRPAEKRLTFATSHARLQGQAVVQRFVLNLAGQEVPGASVSTSAPVMEMPLPPIDAADGTAVAGSSSPSVTVPIAPFQPAGVQTTASCTWSFTWGTVTPLAPVSSDPSRGRSPIGPFEPISQFTPAIPAAPPTSPTATTPAPTTSGPLAPPANAGAAGLAGARPGATGNVLSTTPPDLPPPATPGNLRAQVAGGSVIVEWDIHGIYSGYHSFTVTRNGVAASKRWLGTTFIDVVPAPGEYTYRIRGHGHSSHPNTSLPESTSVETQLTVRVPPWRGWKERYRIVANAVRVNQTTNEDLLIADGRGDEIYVHTHVDLVQRPVNPCEGKANCSASGTLDPTVVGRWRIESPVYGDPDRPASEGRVRAGSLNPGGLAAGDLVPTRSAPYDPSTAFTTPTTTALPQIVWEGELEFGLRGRFLLVTPSVWEYDGNRAKIEAWKSRSEMIRDETYQRSDALSLEPYAWLLTSYLQAGVDTAIGADVNGSYRGRTMVVTPEAIEKLLAAGSQNGLAAGALAFNFVDQSALRGNYTLYMRFERLPSPPVSVSSFTPSCSGGQTLQADGHCR